LIQKERSDPKRSTTQSDLERENAELRREAMIKKQLSQRCSIQGEIIEARRARDEQISDLRRDVPEMMKGRSAPHVEQQHYKDGRTQTDLSNAPKRSTGPELER
jgi:hypothetical protein